MPLNAKISLEQFFNYCTEKTLPFALYRLPETKNIKVIAQKKQEANLISTGDDSIRQKGFLLAPFYNAGEPPQILIAPDIFCDADRIPKLNFADPSTRLARKTKTEKSGLNEMSKPQFLKYIRKIRSKIRSNRFKKIVAGRVVKRKRPEGFKEVDFFRLLCKKYPDAFVSLVFTREYGLWIGASPEILLAANNSHFKTYALAGTKENTNHNAQTEWGKKEIEEQHIVSDYIRETFSEFTKEPPRTTGPDTIAAGNLLHLRTTFSYNSITYLNWLSVVNRLHPTPAVAGLPKKQAIDFILKNEKAARTLYSGYLGPVNLNSGIDLFVNLRCMKVVKNKLLVYVACGITADSKLSEEWRETKMKSETLLNLLTDKKSGRKVSKTLSPLPQHEHKQKGRSSAGRDMPSKGNK